MISTLKGETLWLSVCDDSSASICHLEGDEKKPIEKYEVLKDTKINFLHHVTINARKRLEESYNRARVREIESDADTDDEMDSIRIRTLTDQSAAGETYIPDGCIWVGTEDGKVLIYENEDSSFEKTTIVPPLELEQPVNCVLQHENRVIIASGLADQSYLHVYKRSLSGWSISNPEKINLSSILRSDGNFVDKNFTGFSHMVYVTGRDGYIDEIWASSGANLYILDANSYSYRRTLNSVNTGSLDTVHDSSRKVNALVSSHGYVWVSQDKRPPVVQMWEAGTREAKTPVDIETYVVKQLASCDPILKRHRKQALRVTALHIAASYLWVGTTAGVILSIELNNGKPNYGPNQKPVIQTLDHGHAGPVRFIASTEVSERRGSIDKRRMSTPTAKKSILITGGDGWEEYNTTENNGEEDAKPYLLLWRLR